ncbi:bacterial/archaeal transporter family-2 protein [Ketogulonicigenium robustum]|uniref:Bacterial/archaeal transporter family-2 protein n=1 Tax=Ketogulonicigenium robustum TaxID=92947 RepID=A0A1W6NXT7_9RHOB|nr:DMT family transporter [Ketogulonicigenium robustum]ARO14058.1 bacterial/archaeal transporter family-2 protein [Ketogulonicigenium robustum]
MSYETAQTRAPKPIEIAVALATGGLMTVMLLSNSMMAAHTTPLFSSLTAHGVGTLVLVAALALLRLVRKGQGAAPIVANAPLWVYLGGLSGALTVVVTSTAANSALALTGTLALGLAGQVVLALVFDRFGLLGMTKRLPTRNDMLALVLIIAGTLLIIFGRGAA